MNSVHQNVSKHHFTSALIKESSLINAAATLFKLVHSRDFVFWFSMFLDCPEMNRSVLALGLTQQMRHISITDRLTVVSRQKLLMPLSTLRTAGLDITPEDYRTSTTRFLESTTRTGASGVPDLRGLTWLYCPRTSLRRMESILCR